MRDRGCFDNNTTKFFVACVVEAFDYLHRYDYLLNMETYYKQVITLCILQGYIFSFFMWLKIVNVQERNCLPRFEARESPIRC